jgi:hypothetical protein
MALTPALNDTVPLELVPVVGLLLPLPLVELELLEQAARVSPVTTAHAAIARVLRLVISGMSPFTK